MTPNLSSSTNMKQSVCSSIPPFPPPSLHPSPATSPAIRKILSSHQNLPALLTSIDKLRGRDREDAFQHALGVSAPEITDPSRTTELGEDVVALRELAEAVEAAVRGGKQDVLGLDWGE